MFALTLNPALLVLLASMLAVSLWRDARHHRIDNWITFTGAFLGIAVQGGLAGASGAMQAAAGGGVGLLVLLPFYMRGGMAAGDVKLMAAAGTCLGPLAAFWAGAYTLVTGAFLALLFVGVRGGLGQTVGHMRRQFRGYALTRVWVPAASHSVLSQRFPYAAAIAGGCLLLVFAGLPPGF